MHQELSDFAARLREAIEDSDAAPRRPDGSANRPCQKLEFNSLALELFRLQFQYNPAYQRICRARGVAPEAVGHWTQIPAVPTSAFKELELSCIPPAERTAVFHSSGSTEHKPSRHYHCPESLAIYEASLWSWFATNVLWSADDSSAKYSGKETRGQAVRAPFAAVHLTPPPAQAPHSSLVHMFETVRRKIGGASIPASRSEFPCKTAADGSWTLDFDAALAALNQSPITNHQSLLLLGTAFSFVHLLDFLTEKNLRFNLPAGSRVVETGGYKNRSRSMPKTELQALITERLGIPSENIIREYGMSELSSQAYDGGAALPRDQEFHGRAAARPSRIFHFPPWARAQIISPETGREVAEGEPGLIRVFDLANVFSVAAIQTEDLGIHHENGFELIGRAQFAKPRGCSLMMNEPLAPSLSPPSGERVIPAGRDRVRG